MIFARIAGFVAVVVLASGQFSLADPDPLPNAMPDIIVIEPIALDVHPSGALMPNGVACAIRISDGVRPVQEVVTVGTGESEAMSCVGFVEAGSLPQLGRALGVIYDFESGPNSIFRGAVILTWDEAEQKWVKNEAFEGSLTVNSAVDDLVKLREGLENR